MTTADPLPSVLAAALVIIGAGQFYYKTQYSDEGMLQRARTVLYEAGARSACDARGTPSVSGDNVCWDVSGYRLLKDKDGFIRLYDLTDGRLDVVGGTRKGAEGMPEVFVDRPRLEKAVETLVGNKSA